ncbi:MAG: hypothetical protein ACK5MD_06740 [Flavobacteriales bacterium]
MIFYVILHIVKTYQRNFWGFGILNPKEFAKEWKFTTNYLRSTAPYPYHYKVLTKGLNSSESDIHIENFKKLEKENPEDPSFRVWDSLLEDALYRLANLNIQLRRKGEIYKLNKEKSVLNTDTVGSIQVLKKVTAIYKKSQRGKSTILYDYDVDEDFLINISRLYIKADEDVIFKLKNSNVKNLDTFYLFLINLRDDIEAKGTNIATPYFNILQINHYTNQRNKKQYINKRIESIIKNVPEFIEKFEWIKESKNSKYPYQPQITFYSKFSSSLFKKEYHSFEKNQKFNTIMSNELKKFYDLITAQEKRSMEGFLEYLSDAKFEQERKMAFGYANIILNGTVSYSKKEEEMYKEFIKRLLNNQSIYDLSPLFK